MRTRPRLLPWSENGKPAYLHTNDPTSVLSRLADQMEEGQLAIGDNVLTTSMTVLEVPEATTTELRFAAVRLRECLVDALRVARRPAALRRPRRRGRRRRRVTHSVVQFVNRTIRHALEGGVTFEAFCASGCDEASGPQDDQNTTQDRCPRHTVRHRARLTPTR
ncbi:MULTISPECIES: hypothetical protein [Streptomyces]|uniref:DUF7848 domain-containing protein n=1 Tax=Streptomyces thermoalcalitolerans TaxID=65605 RepID=A0ABN1NLK6_9ACTN|nr:MULTISPECIES: hypothetical protein [Streptomyces]GAT82197.1 hypothetical protein [Streptomyces sp. F-3]